MFFVCCCRSSRFFTSNGKSGFAPKSSRKKKLSSESFWWIMVTLESTATCVCSSKFQKSCKENRIVFSKELWEFNLPSKLKTERLSSGLFVQHGTGMKAQLDSFKVFAATAATSTFSSIIPVKILTKCRSETSLYSERTHSNSKV